MSRKCHFGIHRDDLIFQTVTKITVFPEEKEGGEYCLRLVKVSFDLCQRKQVSAV